MAKNNNVNGVPVQVKATQSNGVFTSLLFVPDGATGEVIVRKNDTSIKSYSNAAAELQHGGHWDALILGLHIFDVSKMAAMAADNIGFIAHYADPKALSQYGLTAPREHWARIKRYAFAFQYDYLKPSYEKDGEKIMLWEQYKSIEKHTAIDTLLAGVSVRCLIPQGEDDAGWQEYVRVTLETMNGLQSGDEIRMKAAWETYRARKAEAAFKNQAYSAAIDAVKETNGKTKSNPASISIRVGDAMVSWSEFEAGNYEVFRDGAEVPYVEMYIGKSDLHLEIVAKYAAQGRFLVPVN